MHTCVVGVADRDDAAWTYDTVHLSKCRNGIAYVLKHLMGMGDVVTVIFDIKRIQVHCLKGGIGVAECLLSAGDDRFAVVDPEHGPARHNS